MSRRQFNLPEEDIEYLDSLGHIWETIDGGWVIIRDYPVPDGYNISKTDIALKIDNGYPISQIDMVYFSPAITRMDGRVIGALSEQPIDGKNWQRWSRHRTPQNPWRHGEDSIMTHMLLVEHWLKREFDIR